MTEPVYFEWEDDLSGIIKTEYKASFPDPLAEPATGIDYLKIKEPELTPFEKIGLP